MASARRRPFTPPPTLTQDFHPANHISFGSRHFGTPTFAFEGGPVPGVGYPIMLQCLPAESGEIADGNCCLTEPMQVGRACLSSPLWFFVT